MTPEQKSRQQIDRQLVQAGWIVQDYRQMTISAGLGVAVREFPLNTGHADYMLYADARAIGVVEAKPKGHTLTGVETQSGKYLDGLPKTLPNYRLPLPFAYESTGEVTQFTNTLEPDARSRAVFTFHRPEELIRLVKLDRQVRDRNVEAASRRFHPLQNLDLGYFDPTAPLAEHAGNLPHWRQEGVTYFVTFRTADSLPNEKLKLWVAERDQWLREHPEPHSPTEKKEYWQLFPERIQRWLDAGSGACMLARSDVRQIVVDAINHFDGARYCLHSWVAMPNHVHVLVSPLGQHELSDILHSWKSFTSRLISKLVGQTGVFWQKESFDHIVRSPESMERINDYIRANPDGLQAGTFSLSPELQTRRDASSTWEPTEEQVVEVEREQMAAVLKAFHDPKLRDAILAAKRSLDQVIDEQTPDQLLRAGFDAQALEKAKSMLTSFRKFIEDNKDEIEALQVLYSVPYRAGLKFRHVKELAVKLNQPPFFVDPNRPESLTRLWQAYELVEAASRRLSSEESQKTSKPAGRRFYLVDIIALVRHAIDPSTPLAPVGMTVEERYQQWMAEKQTAGVMFTADQRKWLDAIKDHIAASLNIEQDDLEEVPFNTIGGLGRAYELFGDKLAAILDELNMRLAA